MPKVDHLRLCNEHGIPFQDFQAQFCSRCLQPECTRSQHGKSRFDSRVTTWEDKLFLNVDRMDPSDERFQNITAHKFLSVDPGNARTQSAWMDPKDLEPTKTISIPEPAPEPPPVVVEAAPDPAPPPKLEEPVAPAAPLGDAVLMNTPNRPRQMIGGAEQKPSSPVLDPWASKQPQPLKPGERLVERGARIRFGNR